MFKMLRAAAGYKRAQGGVESGTMVEHIARLTSTDAPLETNLTTLYNSLVSAGVWDKLDLLCVPHKVEADSILNLLGTGVGPDVFIQGAPPFTADEGWVCTVLAGPYTTNNLFDAIRYDAYDGTLFTYGHTAGSTGNQVMCDGRTGATLVETQAGGAKMAFANQGQDYDETYAGTGGFFGMSCTAQAQRYYRFNATVHSTTDSIAHTVFNADKVKWGHGGTNIWIRCFGYGSGLNALQLSDLRDAIEAYAVSRGFNL